MWKLVLPKATGTRHKLPLLVLFFYVALLYILFNSVDPTKNGISLQEENNNHVLEPSSSNHEEEVPREEENEDDNSCVPATVERNIDPNHTRAHLSYWRSLDKDTIDMYRKAWKSFIEKVPKEGQFRGRGIVFVAGNRDTFSRALVAVKLLRHYGCILPVEIWHLPDENPSQDIVHELLAHNAIPRDLSEEGLPRPVTERRDADKQ